jgi:hypothetical protein
METTNLFKQGSKTIVDTLFEAKLFKDNLTRDELNSVEELLQYMMSSRFESFLRAEKNKMKEVEYKDLNINDRKEVKRVIRSTGAGCRVRQIYLPLNRILNLYK